MMHRRAFLSQSIGGGALMIAQQSFAGDCKPSLIWARGIENQRKADLGNGYYLNPIISGDRPDPSVLVDGDDVYITFSSFEAYPGLHIWHSRDLVNWTPIAFALSDYVGSVWAPELIKHKGKYYIYFAVKHPIQNTIYVVTSDEIKGPWSRPIDLGLHKNIDPGHAVDEHGNRFLFLSGGDRVSLSKDGLKTTSDVTHIYTPWKYPDDWEVEGFSPEGPKIFKYGGFYYIITAIGGTAGPPTGHMVISARAKSLDGPWENCPNNPLVRTKSASELWWSRGHATIFTAPDGKLWAVYHGYERGFMTLGRQTLLVPISYKNGWFDFGDEIEKPIKKPALLSNGIHGIALSDDFTSNRFGLVWNFIQPTPTEATRIKIGNGELSLLAKGDAPSNSPPLGIIVGDRSYEIEVDVEIDDNSWGGILIYYDKSLYAGLGFNSTNFITHQYGMERGKPSHKNGNRMKLKMRNRENIISYFYSKDGLNWTKFDRGMEVSGYNHNVRGGFMMLKPALYSCGKGKVIFRDFKFRAL